MVQPYRGSEVQRRFFLGTNCHVLCIDQQSGAVLWKTPLRSSVNSSLVSLLMHKGLIYAANWRSVACLQADDGSVLWTTKLKKLTEPAALALDPRVPGGQLLVAGAGWLYSLSAQSGALQWENDLPGLGYYPLTLRVPGAVIAQPITRYVQRGKTVQLQTVENEQDLGEWWESLDQRESD